MPKNDILTTGSWEFLGSDTLSPMKIFITWAPQYYVLKADRSVISVGNIWPDRWSVTMLACTSVRRYGRT